MEVSQGRAAHLQTEREWERKELKRERGGGGEGGGGRSNREIGDVEGHRVLTLKSCKRKKQERYQVVLTGRERERERGIYRKDKYNIKTFHSTFCRDRTPSVQVCGQNQCDKDTTRNWEDRLVLQLP